MGRGNHTWPISHPAGLIGGIRLFERVFRSAYVTALAAALLLASPCAYGFSGSEQKADQARDGLVFQLKKFVEAAYVRGDSDAAARELRALASWGIDANDVNPLQAINRCLMPKGLFLTSSYTGSVPAKPVVKLFSIAKQDVFDHFVVDGSKRETLFGRRLGGYRRVLLDREIFSTSDASPVAMPYNLGPSGSSAPAWVIVIPYGSLHDLYGSRDPSMEERLVEELDDP